MRIGRNQDAREINRKNDTTTAILGERRPRSMNYNQNHSGEELNDISG
jgi:hypothetical protein